MNFMEKFKKYLKPTLVFLGIFAFYLVTLLILNYTGLVKLDSIVKINFVVMSIMTLFLGIIEGKKTSKKGYLEGLKLGSIVICILFLLNLMFYRYFSVYLLLYYLVIIASSTIGSMIGINLKR